MESLLIIDLSNTEETLANLGMATGEMAQLFDEIRDLIIEDTAENFEGEHDPDGIPWADLAPETIRKRRRRGTWPGKKLQDSKALVTSVLVRGAFDNVDRETAYSLEFGTSDPKGFRHQQGTSRMPARRFIGMSDRLKTKIEDALRAFMAKKTLELAAAGELVGV